MVRKHRALTILQFLHQPFFNKIAILWANARSMVLQPTDQFLPRYNCRPLEFIKTERGGKKKGEKQSRAFNFSVLQLTIFQLVCYFWGEHMICDIAAHKLTFTPPPLRRVC